MSNERLGLVTAAQVADARIAEAMRFLAIAATTDGGRAKAVETFVDRFPDAGPTPWLRKGLANGEFVNKAVSPATTTNLPFAGNLLPPALLEPLTTRFQQTSALARMGAIAVPPNVPVAYEATAPTLAWVKQGGPKPVSTLTTGAVKLALFKFAGILTLSRELALTTRGDQVMARRLTRASTFFLDAQLLDPTVAAVVDQNPKSLTSGVTPTAAGATMDATIAALTAAFYAQRPTATRPTFVLSPKVASLITTSGNHPGLHTETGGQLLGSPAVVTVGAGSNLILLDADAVYFHDAGAEIDTSRYAAIEAEAAPGTPSAATVLLDLWSHNLIGVRLDRFCAWEAEPTAVAYAAVA